MRDSHLAFLRKTLDDGLIPVVATDPDGTRVFEADITMWVTPRKR